MENKTKKLVTSSLLAALVCIATMIIKIPLPTKGYLNLGDCIILFSAWTLSPIYGFLAAGIGSALADLFSGYVVYAPVTFVIKGFMAIIAYYCFKILNKKIGGLTSRIISGIIAEIEMVAGYFLFEGIMYGFGASVVNVFANGLQGIVGVVLGVILFKMVKKQYV